MSTPAFEEIEQIAQSEGPAAAVDRLIEQLEQAGRYDQLFDALLMKKRLELGLPLVQPTSTEDVPDDKLDEWEECYIESARRVGNAFLKDGQIPEAWAYMRHIREPEAVRDALEQIDARRDADEETEELVNVALYEGANPVKGLEIMLRVNGVCNTVTALDQIITQLSPEDRRNAAALLVVELFDDLFRTVGQDVEQREGSAPAADGLRDLIAGRDWLFENDNYHVDVSHLNAVVRFSRFLEPGDPMLDRAIQLTEYGGKLAPQFQYPADPPFDDFFPAHRRYFQVLADVDRDAGLQFFRDKIDEEPDEEDKPMLCYVLVELLIRIGRYEDALEAAQPWLQEIDDPSGFSFSKLCHQAGRLDTLLKSARDKEDVVTFTAALLQSGKATA